MKALAALTDRYIPHRTYSSRLFLAVRIAVRPSEPRRWHVLELHRRAVIAGPEAASIWWNILTTTRYSIGRAIAGGVGTDIAR